MEEIWKDVKGFENLYKISNCGNVFSCKYGRMLKPAERGGYLRVTLTKDKKQNRCSIHRLVAENFLNNKGNKTQVNHKDGNKKNNHINNLEWVTNKENCNHAVKHDLFHKRKNKKILQFSLDGKFIKRWDALCDIQDELGLNKKTIWETLNDNRRTQSHGFRWKYEEEVND